VKILLIYPGATWSPYDVAVGYESALRALGHKVISFDYHTQYKFYKQYLGYLSEKHELSFPIDAAAVLASERVAISIIDMRPDVIVNVMGVALHRRAYEHAAILGVPMAVILTESPYMDEFHVEMIGKGHVKLVFANDKTSVGPLAEATGVRTEYLPHSYDPARHYPHAVGKEFQSDVFFFGTLWPARQELFKALDLSAYDARVSGTDFSKVRNDDPQIISNDDMALWYSGAKIALNHHRVERYKSGTVAEAYSLGPRAFEIAACGAFQLCDDARPELREVFGDSVATYHDAADLQGKIDYYMAHDEERRDMAAEALQRVAPCSFLNRAREIVMPAIEEILS
jgi:spore maturation protein CgeB